MSDMSERKTFLLQVPRDASAFLNRVLALPAGIHTITLVKSDSGAAGLVGWTVVEGRLEMARPREQESG
ncbi:MAG: hypothetical protein JXB35_10380 [Anaerolineae bacterium]|nr:hypothetical protein [Anaerolineae bacterium]